MEYGPPVFRLVEQRMKRLNYSWHEWSQHYSPHFSFLARI
jgi:hypothetical protein